MDFSLSDEQTAIAGLAEALFRDHCSDEQIAAHAASGAAYDAGLWRQLGETGLLAAPDPAAGGIGMTELALVLEQQGRFLAPAPLWRHQIAGLAVARFAPEGVCGALTPGLAEGALLATLSVEELDAPALRAVRAGDGWRVEGEAAAVAFAGQADWGLLPVQAGEAVRLALLPLQGPAVTRRDGVLTHGEPAADLEIRGLEIAADHLLPAEASPDWLLQRADACLAALQLGVAGEAMRRAAEYVGARQQFGRAIGSFQGVALRAADGYIDTEVLRGAVWQVAWRLDAGLDAAAAAHVAKYLAAQCGHRVAHTAMHLHGGVGADVTYPIHRFLLWSRALEISAGGSAVQLARLGELIADGQAFGAAR
jgi:alkylation response protein AidB-like acyl-CoA dehydrogenase